MRRPAVHRAQETAEAHRIFQIFHVAVGQIDRRPVVEHQQHAGDRQYKEEKERQCRPSRSCKVHLRLFLRTRPGCRCSQTFPRICCARSRGVSFHSPPRNIERQICESMTLFRKLLRAVGMGGISNGQFHMLTRRLGRRREEDSPVYVTKNWDFSRRPGRSSKMLLSTRRSPEGSRRTAQR